MFFFFDKTYAFQLTLSFFAGARLQTFDIFTFRTEDFKRTGNSDFFILLQRLFIFATMSSHLNFYLLWKICRYNILYHAM